MGGALSVLLVYAHPSERTSRINKALLAAAQGIPGLSVHNLYEQYPDFHIDVAKEQAALLAADVVVAQHPLYWYSCPALLKEWLDRVLLRGFAYGDGGTALRGKRWMQALSTGGPAEAYGRDGYNRFTVHEFLRPFEQLMHLCGMDSLEPFVVHGVRKISEADLVATTELYRQLLIEMTRGVLPPVYSSFSRN